ncbi:MAG TPA: ATP-binding protein [Methylomirabilota bacterium]|nr:ATP-binding protein [Methylomirabilota bacterium]
MIASKSGLCASEHGTLASALLECVTCGIIVVSPSRQILIFDDGAEQLTGLRAADLLGRLASALPPALQSLLEETLSTKRPVAPFDLRVPGAEGKSLVVINTELAQQADGEILSVLMKLRNVGQVQEIAAHLEHLDRLANVGVLTEGIAHEIKNALVAVRTFVDLLRERNKDDELAQVVSREITRIDAMVRQVLRDGTRSEFTLAPLAVHSLLRDALNSLRHQLQTRSIQHTLRLDAASDRINGDERQLRHAFFNLLMNSVEAMPGAGRIDVASSVHAVNGRRDLCLTISDTGCGIHPDLLPRLFSPFFTTKKEGTGLGLAITHRIIQQHDGAISVESKVNEGTTFEVRLPLL